MVLACPLRTVRPLCALEIDLQAANFILMVALQIATCVRKSTQALNYFAHRAATGAPARRLNKMKALKLLFFADRYHLRKYGRPVSECAYFATKHGPVASEAKHIAEDSPRLDHNSRSYVRRFVRKDDSYHYRSVADVDHAVLQKPIAKRSISPGKISAITASFGCRTSRIITRSGSGRRALCARAIAARRSITPISSPMPTRATTHATNSLPGTALSLSILSATVRFFTTAGVEPCPLNASIQSCGSRFAKAAFIILRSDRSDQPSRTISLSLIPNPSHRNFFC
jgi:Antitoxin SocA-like, Panacea domain